MSINTTVAPSRHVTGKLELTEPVKQPTIQTTTDWCNYIVAHWDKLKQLAETASVTTPYQELVFISFQPVLPKNQKDLKKLLSLIGSLRYTDNLVKRLTTIYKDSNFKRTAAELARIYLNQTVLQADELRGLDWLLMATGALAGITPTGKKAKSFLGQLLNSSNNELNPYPSAVRVQAGMITAGQNVIFAGQDVNVVTKHYHGDKAKLTSYLASLRTDWNMPATNIYPSSQHQIMTKLHKLYTPIDIWKDVSTFKSADDIEQLNKRRFCAIDQDLHDAREPVLEAIAKNPLIVITGGAGTGKSSLGRFIVTALAYACDPKSESRDDVNGLELLGPAWIHGPMIPLYVNLRDLFNSDCMSPKKYKSKFSSENLLEYIKKTVGSFAPYLESYLTQTDVPTYGTMLVLDGLDEIYEEKDRIVLRSIIENWADRFPTCRVIITSRTYAYRHNAAWRLSDRFVSAELAPFTRKQIADYIDLWYEQAANTRPGNLGGHNIAKERARAMSHDLKREIQNNKALLPLARHPLMLALLTLIHEDYKHLPSKRAELYRQTVELLDRWNIPLPSDKLHEKLATIDLERMRAALKMIAFDLQSKQTHYERYPTTIKRGDLLDKLKNQQDVGEGLGANIEDVLEYLATRNGILVTDTPKLYRFPHLSVQEYLTACALIEFYDECPMPKNLKPVSEDGWVFPENIVALLRHDYARWRNVVLFAGSILADGAGQALRWQLIDELLPPKVGETVADNILHSICVASEIWSESYLKARTRSQHAIEEHLEECLEVIKNDVRVDPPDNAKNLKVLASLKKNKKKK